MAAVRHCVSSPHLGANAGWSEALPLQSMRGTVLYSIARSVVSKCGCKQVQYWRRLRSIWSADHERGWYSLPLPPSAASAQTSSVKSLAPYGTVSTPSRLCIYPSQHPSMASVIDISFRCQRPTTSSAPGLLPANTTAKFSCHHFSIDFICICNILVFGPLLLSRPNLLSFCCCRHKISP